MQHQDFDRAQDELDEVVHRCLLNEVFLLLDFVSGRSDCTLVGLSGVVDPERPGQAMTSTETLMALNHIRYPPADGITSRAREATVLLQAKDRLNNLASPATGLSVAYTTMFAGGAKIGAGGRGLRLGIVGRSARPGGDTGAGPATRATLAENAYPGLVASAKRFRLTVFLLMIGILLVTGFSVWVSYQVAYGRSLMLRLDALDRQKTELSSRIYAAEQTVSSGTAKALRLCDKDGPASIAKQELCDAYSDWEQKNRLAYRDLRNYAHAWGMQALVPHPAASHEGAPSGTQDQVATDAGGQSEQLEASVLTAFSTSILPVQFGLLGAAAAVVRSIYSHVQRRTLTPRQLNLALIRLPLGLVAGVSIGLLYTPDVAAVQGVGGLAGALTLSASGVAFLAGYGLEAVFSGFDALLKRVFAVDPHDVVVPSAMPAREQAAART